VPFRDGIGAGCFGALSLAFGLLRSVRLLLLSLLLLLLLVLSPHFIVGADCFLLLDELERILYQRYLCQRNAADVLGGRINGVFGAKMEVGRQRVGIN